MRARFIRTEGPWLEAVVETASGTFVAMDCISCDASAMPSQGEDFEAEFSPHVSPPAWSDVFGKNAEKKKGLIQQRGWCYLAYGVIESIQPVVVDCGVIQIVDAVHTNDPRVIGEYVCVPIERLDLYRASKKTPNQSPEPTSPFGRRGSS